MEEFKEFNNETINEILTTITTLVWEHDLIIKKIFINNLQEWIEVKSVDYFNRKYVNFSVSKYGVIYYNNNIYMIDEFIAYLENIQV